VLSNALDEALAARGVDLRPLPPEDHPEHLARKDRMKPYESKLAKAKAVRKGRNTYNLPAGHPVTVHAHLGVKKRLLKTKWNGPQTVWFTAEHDEVDPQDTEAAKLAKKSEAAPVAVEPEAPAVVYASPSVREGSTLEHAKANYGSDDHTAQQQYAVKLGAKRVRGALGVWTDGAEESTVAEVQPKVAKVLAAALGFKANQKAALTFTPRPHGQSLRFVIKYPPADFHRVVMAFTDEGVPFHTHFPSTRAYGTADESHVIVDKAESEAGAAHAIHRAAGKLGAQVKAEEGDAEFLGADDRLAARKVFQEILRSVATNRASQVS
jgi:hypothetical protein